jgi:hypothetical protein
MLCARCQCDIETGCTCPDIEERLFALRDTPLWDAARENILARRMKRAMQDPKIKFAEA